MKKYFLFLCVFVILSACTNTIGYLPDDEPKKLIVNAMMQTENNDNRIYLHYTGWTATTPVICWTEYQFQNKQKSHYIKKIRSTIQQEIFYPERVCIGQYIERNIDRCQYL